MEIKRSKFVFIQFSDTLTIDFYRLFNGEARLVKLKQAIVYSVVAQNSFVLTKEEIDALYQISSVEWEVIDHYPISQTNIESFANKGIVIVRNSQNEIFERYEMNERSLVSDNWNELAAFYHFSTKWGNLNLNFQIDRKRLALFEDTNTVMANYINQRGLPPSHFVTNSNTIERIELPKNFTEDEFFNLLRKRKTTRIFDEDKYLSQSELSKILYYTFGCHGISSVYKDGDNEVFAIKRTSPSGGGLHPTEAYVLVNRVENLSTGLYHYNVQTHSLDCIKTFDIEKAKELANTFTAGQDYPASANVVIVLTSRYYRNFWKYNKHPHAFKVLLMDAAHLSQTFYLVCAKLDLGAFTTAAINSKNIEEELNLDSFKEGAVLVVGCGYATGHDLAPEFEPYAQ